MRGTTIMLALIFSIAGCNRGSKDPTKSDTVVDTGAITDTGADGPPPGGGPRRRRQRRC